MGPKNHKTIEAGEALKDHRVQHCQALHSTMSCEPNPPNPLLPRLVFSCPRVHPGNSHNPKISTPASSSSSHSPDRAAVAFLCLQPRCSFPSSLCGTFVPPNKRETLCSPARELLFPVWVLMKGETLETSRDGSGPVSN